jgi:hypothetical protein
MTCSGTRHCGPVRRAFRRIPRGLLASVCAGSVLACGSVVMSFEASPQDGGKPPAKSKQAASGEAPGKAPANGKAARKLNPAGSDAALGPTGPLPKRPARTVTPPSLTSADLDGLIKQYLQSTAPGVEPAPLTGDIEFVRRIYFDVIGQPPTRVEIDAFLRDHTKDKRARLIDKLLATPEYARHWGSYWRDVIGFNATTEFLDRYSFHALGPWLAGQFQANAPWDEIVTGMITASGRNDENAAVELGMAYEMVPVEMAGEVSRIFMGVQIQCAQCHDHKTDSWKRREFHEFAAFFSGSRVDLAEVGQRGQRHVYKVIPYGARRYTMPDLDDPQKHVPIAPKFFLASSKANSAPALPEELAVKERRALAASYITGQDNPWFAKAFINRIWYVLIGEAFYEPIDDIGPARTPRAPQVLEPLSSQWQAGGYDIRWLLRTILNTEAYQRRVRSTLSAAGKTPFASNCPSRYRADQLFNAVAHALATPVVPESRLVMNAKGGAGMSPGQERSGPTSQAQRLQAAQRGGASLGQMDLAKSAGQGVAAGNGSMANANMANGSMANANMANGSMANANMADAAMDPASRTATRPAIPERPGGYPVIFDELFGADDPSLPNEDVMGTIPQALFLMNAPLVSNGILARPGMMLGKIMSASPNPRNALRTLYMQVLSRPPTTEEAEICSRYIRAVGNQAEAFEDIYWSLINSTEFLTRR